jgi:transposase
MVSMPTSTKLELSAQEREALEQMRDKHPKGYARERAAALLKIADGSSATQVAYKGLLKRRYPHAVCEWVRRYKAEGTQGLLMRDGRGRKPAFSPSTTKQPTSHRSDTAPAQA